ncbi:MAG: hypothetical protein ABEI39_00625 [Halobacteriales archaeon]
MAENTDSVGAGPPAGHGMTDAAQYREAVYEAFADSEVDVEERVERVLEVGTEYLGMPIGFLIRIEDGTPIEAVARRPTTLFR